MAKLAGHYFNRKAGGFRAFEVDNLKETENQYKKTAETIGDSPEGSYDYWKIILKSELGQLRAPGSDVFIMFAPEPDMIRFKALVTERLERAAEGKKQRYDAALSVLEFARGLAGEEPGHPSGPAEAGGVEQPLVTVTFSEHERLRGIQNMPLYLAEAIFEKLDAMPREIRSADGSHYHKTDFRIDYIWRGKKESYTGHYDVGDGGGSLTGHILDYADYNLAVAGQGISPDTTIANLQFISARIVPFFRKHCELSRLEADAQAKLEQIRQSPDPAAPRAVYLESVTAYVGQARAAIGVKGLEGLPEPPPPFTADPGVKDGKPSVLGKIRAARKATQAPKAAGQQKAAKGEAGR
jgi:hypothetical protein